MEHRNIRRSGRRDVVRTIRSRRRNDPIVSNITPDNIEAPINDNITSGSGIIDIDELIQRIDGMRDAQDDGFVGDSLYGTIRFEEKALDEVKENVKDFQKFRDRYKPYLVPIRPSNYNCVDNIVYKHQIPSYFRNLSYQSRHNVRLMAGIRADQTELMRKFCSIQDHMFQEVRKNGGPEVLMDDYVGTFIDKGLSVAYKNPYTRMEDVDKFTNKDIEEIIHRGIRNSSKKDLEDTIKTEQELDVVKNYIKGDIRLKPITYDLSKKLAKIRISLNQESRRMTKLYAKIFTADPYLSDYDIEKICQIKGNVLEQKGRLSSAPMRY